MLIINYIMLRPTRIRDIKMKNVFKISLLTVILGIAMVSFSSCQKDFENEDDGAPAKVTAIQWIQT